MSEWLKASVSDFLCHTWETNFKTNGFGRSFSLSHLMSSSQSTYLQEFLWSTLGWLPTSLRVKVLIVDPRTVLVCPCISVSRWHVASHPALAALRPLWRLTCQAGSASEPLRKLLSSSRELFPDVLMARSSSVCSTVALSVKPSLTMTPLARTSSFLSFASIIVTIVSYNCSQKLSPYTGRYFFNNSVFTVTSLHMTTAVSPSHDHHGTSTQVHSTSSAAVIQMISQNQYRREGR